MKPYWKRKIGFFILAFPLFFMLMGYVVMLLWNNTLAEITPLQRINFWQAVGLLILCRILFGGFRFNGPRGGGGGPNHPKAQQWREKWMDMSDEERERFKSEWKKRCQPK
jgi:hypothetical protein